MSDQKCLKDEDKKGKEKTKDKNFIGDGEVADGWAHLLDDKAVAEQGGDSRDAQRWLAVIVVKTHQKAKEGQKDSSKERDKDEQNFVDACFGKIDSKDGFWTE